jgi:integration host factor subunit alpha
MGANGPTRTLTRKDLRRKVHEKLPNLLQEQSNKLTDKVFDLMIESLVNGEQVKLREFGVFKVHNKKERLGRNPKTGVEAVITARRSVKFLASPVLKARVNGEDPSHIEEDAE